MLGQGIAAQMISAAPQPVIGAKNCKFIAHRGNVCGPNAEDENKQEYVEKALTGGFEAEMDLWLVDGDHLFSGHDTPEHPVDIEWLYSRRDKLWIHAKDAMVFHLLYGRFNCFMHGKDTPLTLTSLGFIWCCPIGGLNLSKHVIVDPAGTQYSDRIASCAYGYCADDWRDVRCD